MFNFKDLKLDKRADIDNTSSFVGIRRTEHNTLEFRLPKGFENFPENDFNATKQLFFKMYRTFKKFENDKTRLPTDEKPAGKDNVETMGNAYRFKDKEDNEVLLYSKISVIENLLEAYRDLALDVIERRYGLDEKIDYAKINQYLHKAVYLPNDVIYLDEMELPRHVLRYESTTIIDLFCFILMELEAELEQESDERVKELSYRFKEQHLSYEQSLFNEETFEATISILKDVLEDIDKITAYKDDDYWRLYEAIENFLYGELDMENLHEDGIFWGISNFYQIWEDMCNTYAFTFFDDVIYADTNIVLNDKPVANAIFGGHKLFKKDGFENSFFIEFRGNKRWMRPDLIRFVGGNKNNIFEDNIKINITSTHNNRLDFEVRLINKDTKNIYETFCNRLKAVINNNNKRKIPTNYKIGGVSFKGDNIFKNYPKDIFNQEKEFCEKNTNTCIEIKLLDWKYMDEHSFKQNSNKLDSDITKQLCYEFCLNENKQDITKNNVIESQFVIPCFFNQENDIGELIEGKLLYSRLTDNKIKVFKANFALIQEIYLNHD